MKKLWTRDFSLLIIGTILGAAGGIAGSFALSFLVFDETGSTLASALILAIQIVPAFFLPLIISPWMDRFPRKPFLVAGDYIDGVLFLLLGIYLSTRPFSYIGYLIFSLVIACLNTFDQLAYDAIVPNLITKGLENKGYAVTGMLYPVMKVIMTPLAAVLIDTVGTSGILMMQGVMSIAAATAEVFIKVKEPPRERKAPFSFRTWAGDIKEASLFLKKEKGLQNIYLYMGFTNGAANGYSPYMIAFFRTMPGFTIAMYSAFSVAEFAGRTIGGLLQYNYKFKPEKRFGFIFMVYQIYEIMDMILLWIPYPFMLVNRAICGFLGMNSATMRHSAVQTYIPDEMRARLNAFAQMALTAFAFIMTLVMGALGDVFDRRVCMTIFAGLTLVFSWLTIGRAHKEVAEIYSYEAPEDPDEKRSA
ncbi:MAG: MFS transporter [Eubacterium sp.]|jgi:DHA3 family macrolide efflux protein-like MFS transporter